MYHLQSCELRQIYKKTTQLIFFFSLTQVFPSDSVRICHTKLKIDMLYHINNHYIKYQNSAETMDFQENFTPGN